jgi:hypothetical protein
MSGKALEAREGYRESSKPDDLQRELGALASRHGLFGCVLVQFGSGRVGVRSWGVNELACAAMTSLGDRILIDIDDGRHDPLEHIPAEGSA